MSAGCRFARSVEQAAGQADEANPANGGSSRALARLLACAARLENFWLQDAGEVLV